MGIVTKRGDCGRTTTLAKEEYSKADIRLELTGTLDELNAAVGLARSLAGDAGFEAITAELHGFQLNLFRLGAEFSAGPDGSFENHITDQDITALEERIADLEEQIGLPRSFVVPGNTPPSAAVDLARAVSRRLERRLVQARDGGLAYRNSACVWVNRVSDYLFMVARALERGSKGAPHE